MTQQQPLTDQQLTQIEARTTAATDGPWTLHEDDGDTFRAPAWEVLPASGEMVARLREWASADAEFIAHARADVPMLLAEVRRLRAELARRVQCNDCGAVGPVFTGDDGLAYLDPTGQIGHPAAALAAGGGE